MDLRPLAAAALLCLTAAAAALAAPVPTAQPGCTPADSPVFFS